MELLSNIELFWLCKEYGWSIHNLTGVKRALFGVTTSVFHLEFGKNRYIIKRRLLTPSRVKNLSIRLEWLVALSKFIRVPRVIMTMGGAKFAIYPSSSNKILCYDVQEFLAGRTLFGDKLDNYMSLGLCARLIRQAGDTISSQYSPKWNGFNIPKITLKSVLEIAADPIFTNIALFNDQATLGKWYTTLSEIFSSDCKTYTFIHGDLHFWNILNLGKTLAVIDFDESCFAPPELDLAPILFRTMRIINGSSLQQAFLNAYEYSISPSRILQITSLQAFRHIGKSVHQLIKLPAHSSLKRRRLEKELLEVINIGYRTIGL